MIKRTIQSGVLIATFLGTSIAWSANAAKIQTAQVDACITELATPKAPENDNSEIISRKLNALDTLVAVAPKAFPKQNIESSDAYLLLTNYLLPTLRYKTRLIINAFVGAANMGKSMVLNSIPPLLSGRDKFKPEDVISPPDMKPGFTLRPLIVLGPQEKDSDVMRDVTERYGETESFLDGSQMQSDGKALVYQSEALAQYAELGFVDGSDLSTGDPNVTDGPAHLELARRAYLPADIFYLMFDDRNFFDFALAKRLTENFAKYGTRPSVLIMRAGLHNAGPAEMERLRRMLVISARRIYKYDDAENVDELPKEVRGLYVFFDRAEVHNRIVHPELIALGDSPDFIQMIHKSGEDWAQIKADAITNTSKKLTDYLVGLIDQEIKQRYVSEIYGAATRATINLLAQSSTVPLPYDQAARTFRNLYNSHGPISKKTNPLLDNTTGGYKFLPKLGQKSRSLADLNEHLKVEMKAGFLKYIPATMGMLASRRISLPANTPDAIELKRLLKAYHDLYPDEVSSAPDLLVESSASSARGGPVDPSAPEEMVLPSDAYLSATARAEFQNFVNVDPAGSDRAAAPESRSMIMANSMLNSPGGVMRSRLYTELLDANLKRIAQKTMVSKETAFDRIFDGAQFMSGLYAVTHLSAVTGHWYITGAGALATMGVRRLAEYYGDQSLRPLMDAWYRTHQSDQSVDALTTGLAAPLLRALEPVDDERAQNLKIVQDMIKIIDPSYVVRGDKLAQ